MFPKEQCGKAANKIDAQDLPQDEKLTVASSSAMLDISDYLKARGRAYTAAVEE